MQKLLDTLHEALPSMSLIASDFSYLPDVSIPGDRAPLVSSKVTGFYFSDYLVHFFNKAVSGVNLYALRMLEYHVF
jgi:hypothetical protein